jgi:type I restriction enzyme S subunit
LDIVSEEKTESKHIERIIPEGWEVKKIGDIGKVITGKTPSTKEKKYWGHGYPFVTPSDIADFDTRYNYGAEREVTEEWLKVAKNSLLPKDAVCFVCIGSTIGKMCLLKEPSFTNQQINSVVVDEDSDSMFTYYLFRKKQKDIRSTYGGGGAAKDIVSKSTFENIDLILPVRKEEQASIAKILSDLDSKIETNHHMNKTLEAIGRAVFKRWFVDFEFPNEEGKPYKSSGGEMINSELGEIPKDWEVKSVGDVLELAYGRALKETVRQAGSTPVYGSNGQIGWHNEKLVKGPGIVVGRKGNPGTVLWSETDFFPIDTTFYVVPKDTAKSLYYLFYVLKNQGLASLSADSAVPGLNRNIVYMNPILVPTPTTLSQFDAIIRGLFYKVQNNNEQIAILSQLRDSLLPKLMSGKIRVPVSRENVEVS